MEYAVIYVIALWTLAFVSPFIACQPLFHFNPKDLTLLVGGNVEFNASLSGYNLPDGEVIFYVNHKDLLTVEPVNVSLSELEFQSWNITLHGISPGHAVVAANISNHTNIYPSDAFVRVTVEHSNAIYITSQVVGWIYFVAWSVSFYPQIYSNWKRRSVVGLNFDFLSFNIIGFILYSIFNCGLYFIPYIEDEYSNRYPRGVNPVLMNDVFFSCHAAFATALTIFQCFIYERANQAISMTAKGIMALFFLVIVIMAGLSGGNVVHWLDFLYACSYVKLVITLIKYVPQAYMNYQRKSTEGWSIGNIFCDFTGGALSMLQMILNGYNYDDWISIFGDPTKFGLGLFSVLFDMLFFIQHYVLYRNNEPYAELEGLNNPAIHEKSSAAINI